MSTSWALPLKARVLEKLRSALQREGHAPRAEDLNRPRYGTDPAMPGTLVRFEPDGRRTPGHLEHGRFVAIDLGRSGTAPATGSSSAD